ncbi:porin [Nitratireductor sp. XY-223]|uniref:porin n=1 Tax=Nitratireductor sp. XY-223 TaxID=2561926 RepID=UPI0010AABB55|nr:porin [Nitratireductor sp. XY-223]
MRRKTILLATTLLGAASSPAFSADAIVAAEPEPVEYVRVCDAFGAGYFYIPGTETCLKLSGFVRLDIGFLSEADSYSSAVRGRLNIQAKEDTELGVLHAYLRFQGQNAGGGDSTAVVDQAYAELGGLVFGYTETTWVMSKNGGASGFGSHSDNGLAYGYGQANQVGYNFTGENFFAAISLNDDGDATSYMPDVTGRIGGVFGGATIYGAFGYDQSAENFGVKLGLNTDIGPAGNLIVQGFYADGPTSYGANLTYEVDFSAVTGITPSYVSATFTPEWSLMASYQHQFAPNFKGSVGGQYSGNYYAAPIATSAAIGGIAASAAHPLGAGSATMDVSTWALEGVLVWNPVDNLEVRGEVRYIDIQNSTGSIDNQTTGLFRLQRSF